MCVDILLDVHAEMACIVDEQIYLNDQIKIVENQLSALSKAKSLGDTILSISLKMLYAIIEHSRHIPV